MISRSPAIRHIIFSMFLAGIMIFAGSCQLLEKPDPPAPPPDISKMMPLIDTIPLWFGIDTSGCMIIPGRIRSNQFLSEILDDWGISYGQIDALIRNSRGTFDPREMKAGSHYTLVVDADSSRARYMIYEQDIINSFIFCLEDSLYTRRITREIHSDLKYASGTIESSLWNAIIEKGYNPVLAVELSEIYAWTIDFFGLQAGDRFRIIYEEDYVEEQPVGVRKIYGAWFEHAGREFYAIPFIQDSTESYYDQEGNSLRKAFLKAPLRFNRISSRYSSSRMHPVLRIRRPHYGVDYAAPTGTPVQAIGDGKVIMAEYQSESGRIVKVRHNSVYTTAYMHLSRFGKGIAPGSWVNQGDIIGYVGSSGLSTGPHLDFRFYKNGQPVDPLKVEAPSVEPVSEENMEKFNKIRSVIIGLLDSI